jgi:DNA-binding protein YbaB
MKNLAGLMKQASQMQSKMQEMQANLEALEMTGEAAAAEEMQKVTGGLQLPPGMKLPF